MKKNILWIVKMTAIYSFWGIILQAAIVNLLFASSPSEGQNLRDVKLSVKAINVTFHDALKIIEQKTDFKFNYIEDEIPINENVTISVTDESLYNILEVFANDYGLIFNRINNQITIKKSVGGETEKITAIAETGSIKGKIIDAQTKEPLIGANIVLKGTTIGVTTNLNGYYEFENLTTGNYTIVVKYVGYATKSENINIFINKTVELNFSLEPSLVDLDEVVVSGAFGQTEKRALPNPITSLKVADIQTLPSTSVNEILQNKVPGYYQIAQQEGNVGTNSYGLRGPTSLNGPAIKYYLDGVPIQDLGNFFLLGNLNNIERIEVLRGPMSTTLYGSRANAGVVNIVSKKPLAGKTNVNFSTAITAITNKYATGTPLQNEQTLNVSGGTNQYGYNIGLSHWDRDYALQPSTIPRASFWGLDVGLKSDYDPLLIDIHVSYAKTTTGTFEKLWWHDYARERGWGSRYNRDLVAIKTNYQSDFYTLKTNLNLRQILSSNWYHNLTAGYENTENQFYKIPSTSNSADPIWNTSLAPIKRYTLRYFMNYNTYINDVLKIDLTGGFEHWQFNNDSFALLTSTSWGNQFPNSEDIISDPDGLISTIVHTTEYNYGYFGESVLSYDNKLFLTTGLRVEKNSGFSDNFDTSVLPRIGLSYVQELGDVTLKPRVSWGLNINPPFYNQVIASVTPFWIQLANPDLKPEKNSGYEIGADIYYGNLFSFEVTYYNQKASDLIYQTYFEDEESNFYVQYVNLNEVLNEGFEFSGYLNLNPFSLSATFTSTNSKVGNGAELIGYSEGDRLINIPISSLNLELTYKIPSLFSETGKGGSVGLRANYTGSQRQTDYLALYDSRYIPGAPRYDGHTIDIKSYTLFGLTANYWVTDFLQVYVFIKNLTDKEDILVYTYPIPGRQSTLGLKFNF
ncbi:MAG: TonB-dependent receptor [Bacteroidota bacterium]